MMLVETDRIADVERRTMNKKRKHLPLRVDVGASRASDDGRAQFPHERLDAYQVALAVARGSKALSKQIPRGHRSIADHLL